jgi:transposase
MNTPSSIEQNSIPLLLKVIQELRNENKLLKEQIEWMKRKLFGKSSERFVADPADSLYLPGLGPETGIIPREEEIEVPAHKKRKSKSTLINTITYPDDLPVETQVLDLPEEEKIDKETGAPLVCIGEDTSKKLGFKTGSYFIKQIIRKKYALPQNPDIGIKTAELPDSVIPRCAVDESFLADVIVKKFCDHLPLYRQAEIRTRDEIYVSRQTLSSYITRIATTLKPLYLCLLEAVKASGNVFVDETPVDVLAPGKGKTNQGYMMVLLGGQSLDPALRVYHFISSRGHDEVMGILEDYEGFFHSDNYKAYEKLGKNAKRKWGPCFAHIRRKFDEAESGDRKFRQEVLLDIQALYTIEREVKSLSPEDRMKIRQEKAVPIIDALIEKNKKMLEKNLLPKSKLSRAIGYLLGLSPYLKNYTLHPFAGIDNNPAERALKLVVIGRKNWLFLGSEGGGESAAILYSLAQTARALKINPHEYFEDVLRRIQSHSFSKLDELLPQNWEKS